MKVGIVGLGFVGNALEKVINRNVSIIKIDPKLKTSVKDLQDKDCDILFICVPTPIFKNNKPDLKKIISATKLVALNLNVNSIVIYESTVYPGLTEEICIPILEKFSKLKSVIQLFLSLLYEYLFVE